MNQRIFLVGFMGAGKTTVGRLLAARLDWAFVDLDAEIERSEGLSVAGIFETKGERWFRAREVELLGEVSAPQKRVIALGGGAYVNPANRTLVDSRGVSVYLHAPLEVLIQRIGDARTRPLARNRGRLETLFGERLESYRMAGAIVDTSDRAPEDVVEEILKVVGDS